MHIVCLCLRFSLLLLDRPVRANDHRMVSLIRLQSDLLLRLQLLCLHLLDLTSKHFLWLSSGVNAVCLLSVGREGVRVRERVSA